MLFALTSKRIELDSTIHQSFAANISASYRENASTAMPAIIANALASTLKAPPIESPTVPIPATVLAVAEVLSPLAVTYTRWVEVEGISMVDEEVTPFATTTTTEDSVTTLRDSDAESSVPSEVIKVGIDERVSIEEVIVGTAITDRLSFAEAEAAAALTTDAKEDDAVLAIEDLEVDSSSTKEDDEEGEEETDAEAEPVLVAKELILGLPAPTLTMPSMLRKDLDILIVVW